MSVATRFLMLTLVGLSTACAHMTPAMPERVSWVEPKQGETTQISIGDTVLSAGNALQVQVIALPHRIVVAGYEIPAADYRVVGTRNGTEYRAHLQPGQAVPTGRQRAVNALFGQPKPASTTNLTWKKAADGSPQLCLAGCVSAPSARLEWADDESFEQRLVFTGFQGRNLHMEYREFTNDRARPAFTTPLRFDLKQSRVVDVKGARIEILGINSQALRFRVLEPFRASDPVADRRGRRPVKVPASIR